MSWKWMAAAIGGLAAPAMAQFESVNSNAIGLRYFNDIPSSTVQVVQNTYPGLLQIQESFPVRPAGGGGVNRHIGVLSADSGVTPFVIPHDTAWLYQATVRMEGDASTEIGLHIGGLGSTIPPWNTDSDTGVLMVNGQNGEIAAFGGWLPFFSTFDPAFAYMGHGARAQDFRLGILVRPLSPTSVTAEYFVDGRSTGPLALDAGAVLAYYALNNSASVYATNTWRNTGPTTSTSTFSNFAIVPSPGVGVVLGLGAAVASRRRRRCSPA